MPFLDLSSGANGAIQLSDLCGRADRTRVLLRDGGGGGVVVEVLLLLPV